MRAGTKVSGPTANRILSDSRHRPELTTGYYPYEFFQHKTGFIFSGKIINVWSDDLTRLGIMPNELPILKVHMYYANEAEFNLLRDTLLIDSVNKNVAIPPTELAIGVNQSIADKVEIQEFFKIYNRLNIGKRLEDKLSTYFFRNTSGQVVSVSMNESIISAEINGYPDHVFIRQRFNSVDHAVRWIVYWDATTIDPR